MPSNTIMKAALQAYVDRFNNGDVDGVGALYADDATLEDPVGTAPKAGKAAIIAFYRDAIATGAKLSLAAPIRGSHGDSAAMAFNVAIASAGIRINVIDVMTFNDDGAITSMRAFWGADDVSPL